MDYFFNSWYWYRSEMDVVSHPVSCHIIVDGNVKNHASSSLYSQAHLARHNLRVSAPSGTGLN